MTNSTAGYVVFAAALRPDATSHDALNRGSSYAEFSSQFACVSSVGAAAMTRSDLVDLLYCQLRCSPSATLREDVCPPAIGRLVMAVRVNSIKGQLCRAWPHIFPKSREVVSPAVTDANTSRPIRLVAFVVGVIASLVHVCPRCIFLRSVFIHPMTV